MGMSEGSVEGNLGGAPNETGLLSDSHVAWEGAEERRLSQRYLFYKMEDK